MPAERARVLVAYQHPLLGRGLERLLAAESGLDVSAVDESDDDAVDEALAGSPDIIVFEDGGGADPLELFRRSDCGLLIGISIASSDAWTIRRQRYQDAGDRLYDLILTACLGKVDELRLPTTARRSTRRSTRRPTVASRVAGILPIIA